MSTNKDASSHETLFSEVFAEFVPTSQLDNYNKSVYYVDIDNIRLLILNSFHPGEYNQITGSQLQWFQDSTNDKSKIKFVFSHSPAFPTGAHVGSSLDEYPDLRDKFWKVIDQSNVMTYFCGHEHIYARTIIDSSFSTKNATFTRSVNQVIAGSAGAPIYRKYTSTKGVVVPPIPIYHFVVIDVGNVNTTIKAYSLDGNVIDEFSLKNIY